MDGSDRCPRCGGEVKVIEFNTRRLLLHPHPASMVMDKPERLIGLIGIRGEEVPFVVTQHMSIGDLRGVAMYQLHSYFCR